MCWWLTFRGNFGFEVPHDRLFLFLCAQQLPYDRVYAQIEHILYHALVVGLSMGREVRVCNRLSQQALDSREFVGQPNKARRTGRDTDRSRAPNIGEWYRERIGPVLHHKNLTHLGYEFIESLQSMTPGIRIKATIESRYGHKGDGDCDGDGEY